MERWLRFRGANNTRDLGRLPADGGKVVAAGRLYRSGELSKMSKAAYRALKEKYHVKQIVDLRTAEEIYACPLPSFCNIPYLYIPILKQAMRGITRDGEPMRKKMNAILAAGMSEAEFMRLCYMEMVSSPDAQQGYRRLFDALLVNEDDATLFYCSAGRDRTGIAALLILSALGVPEDATLDDYMLTPTSIRRKCCGVRLLKALHLMSKAEADFASAFMLPSIDRMNGALDWIKGNYGSVEVYLRDAIGLTPDDLTRLKELYLNYGKDE